MRYKWACLRTSGCGQKFARASAHTFFPSPLTQPPQFQGCVYAHSIGNGNFQIGNCKC